MGLVYMASVFEKEQIRIDEHLTVRLHLAFECVQ